MKNFFKVQRKLKGDFKVRTLKVKSISIMLVFTLLMTVFMPLTVFAEKDLSDITFTGGPSTVFDSLRIDGYQINDCTTEMKGKGWSVKNDTIYLNNYDSSGITIRAFDNVSAVQIVVTTNSEITDGLYGINCNVGLRLQGSGSSSASTLDINAGSCGINCTGLLGFYNGRFNISCIDNGKTYAGINQSHYMIEHCTIAKNATVVVDWKATSWDDFYGIKGVSIISGSDDGIGKLSVATENKGKGNAYATDMSDSDINTIKSSATVYPSDEQHFFVNMVGIDRLDLTVVEPEIGKTPSKVVSVEQSGVGVEIAGWMEKGKGTYLKDTETYKASTEYIPQFLVKLSDFCEYYPDVEVTVNGKTATFNKMQANNNKVISDISFKTGNNVTFDLNGGTWTDAGTNPQVVYDGETAIRPTNPTKSGHVFAGWYADSACTTPFSFLTAITSNKTIYAKWNIITNSVNAILSPTPSVGLTIGDLVLTAGDSSKYSVSAGYWKLNDSGSVLDKSSTQFEAGQTYTLYLTYYPENGYVIPDDATYTVNGIPTEWSGFEAKSNRKISFTIPAVTTYTVSGSVTSFNDASGDITLQLIPEGLSEPAYETTVKGNTVAYSFADVAAGTYTMKVSKANHVTREYTVVGNSSVLQDVKIHLLGDINGDGKVTTIDFGRANSHAKGVAILTGYELLCVDTVKQDGLVKTADAGRVNAHARGTSLLW